MMCNYSVQIHGNACINFKYRHQVLTTDVVMHTVYANTIEISKVLKFMQLRYIV